MRPSRSTFDAAFAALALVFRDFAMTVSFGRQCTLKCTYLWISCQLWCTMQAVVDNETGDPNALGRELASARLAARRSLRNVAGESDISAAYLQKLERGQVEDPSPRILRRLSGVLRVDYSRLMHLAGYKLPSNRHRVSPLETRFADARLTEAEERAVAAFIDHLVEQREPE